MEKTTSNEITIKNVEITETKGFFPNNRAFFISGKRNKNEIYIHGGSNKHKEFDQIDIYNIKDNEFKNLLNISTIESFLVFDKPLSGHSSNTVVDQAEQKIFIFGGFNGKNYSNLVYLIDASIYYF